MENKITYIVGLIVVLVSFMGCASSKKSSRNKCRQPMYNSHLSKCIRVYSTSADSVKMKKWCRSQSEQMFCK
jgi:hypothetical protein